MELDWTKADNGLLGDRQKNLGGVANGFTGEPTEAIWIDSTMDSVLQKGATMVFKLVKTKQRKQYNTNLIFEPIVTG